MKTHITKVFGTFENQEIKQVILTNDSGLSLGIINFGAIIQSIKLPERFSKRDLVLGFDTFEEYISEKYRQNYPYLGAVIGRHSGRIKDGQTKILGKAIQLPKNHGGHHLHGGNVGFDSKVWNFEEISDSMVKLSLLSPDGDENYPGNLQVTVTYEFDDDDNITVTYDAETDQPTILNLTQHSYFNLNQQTDSILEDQIKINSHKYLEFNKDLMPTGEVLQTKDSQYDFSEFKNIPSDIDNSFLINPEAEVAAILKNHDDSIRMEVSTTQPIVHIYSGYYVPELTNKNRRNTQPNAGVCFETIGYLDADNHEKFPSNVLMPDKKYHHKTSFKFKY